MDQLRRIVQVCAQHYEKLVLSLMLVLLALAVAVLWRESQREAENLKQFIPRLGRSGLKAVKQLDVSGHRALLEEARNPSAVALAGAHNLFNPVRWQRRPDGTLQKVVTGKEIGPEALEIIQVRPLHFILAATRIGADGSCWLSFTNELTPLPLRDRQVFVSASHIGRTNRLFVLREIRDPTNAPAWVVELTNPRTEEDKRVVITKDKSFQRVEGYEADLRYPPAGNRVFSRLRVGTNYVLRLEGEDYNIVAIAPDRVVLSGRLNDQQYTVTRRAAP